MAGTTSLGLSYSSFVLAQTIVVTPDSLNKKAILSEREAELMSWGQRKKLQPLPLSNTLFPTRIAQTLPPISPPPGTITPPRPGLPPAPSIPPETPTPVFPLSPPPLTPPTPPPELEVKVKVERIEVLGSTVFSKAQLDKALASFIGKEATYDDLLAIRTAVTNLYTTKGYTTSGAFLPSQEDLATGVVKIQVVEGAIERVEIQGLRRLRQSYVRSRIGLASKAPVNIKRLEQALQLLQLDPLFSSVQAELTAGKAPGLSVLKLTLKEAQPVNASLLVDNRQPPSVGSTQGTAILSDNDLLGFGDRITADVGLTKGLTNYDFGYNIPVNARDGTLSLRYAHNSNLIIEQPFAPLNITGRQDTYSIGFRQPIIRTPNSEFALSLSGDVSQSQTFLLRNIPFSFSEGPIKGRSRVTALRFSQEWTQRFSNQVIAARSQFNVGLGILGATVNNGIPDSRFFSWIGQFQYVRTISQDSIFLARLGAQLTPDSLLPIEQFSIGGLDTVRGYRQNQRVSDNGIVSSLETRFPIIRSPRSFGVIQLAPFFDVGRAWNHTGRIPSPATLASLGLGLNWQISNRFSARLDYGIPLYPIRNQGNSLQDKGLFFSIQFQPF